LLNSIEWFMFKLIFRLGLYLRKIILNLILMLCFLNHCSFLVFRVIFEKRGSNPFLWSPHNSVRGQRITRNEISRNYGTYIVKYASGKNEQTIIQIALERFGIPLQTDKDFELILSSLSCRVTGSDELENGDHLFLQEKGIYLSLQRSNQIALGQEEEKKWYYFDSI